MSREIKELKVICENCQNYIYIMNIEEDDDINERLSEADWTQEVDFFNQEIDLCPDCSTEKEEENE